MPGERLARMASFFAVIPKPPQAEPGTQWYLRSARLDPGSALRAVRDDVKREGGDGGDVLLLAVIPGPPQAEPGIQ